MSSNNPYNGGFPKIDFTKEGIIQLLEKIASFTLEERDLALDRFKRVNNDMETNEDFWAHGKNAVLYLNSASQSTASLKDIVKEIMKVVFKDSITGTGADDGSLEMSLGDKEKSELSKIAAEQLNARRTKKKDSDINSEDEGDIINSQE